MMRLQDRKFATLVHDEVEDLEYFVPLMRLEEEGAEVLTAALELKPLRGKHGLSITPGVTIESLRAEDLSGLIVPGGWAPDKLRRHAAVRNIVREIDGSGKTLAIICHGGLVAISAGIDLRGRPSTGSLGIKDDLVNAGATWVDEPAFRDGNRVWGRVVEDIPAFCRELVAALVEEKNAVS
jgi:deglycase